MKLNYKIKFYDYWHLSSGLSSGARLDSLVSKDKNNIPYIPGKTIKGLLHEIASELKDDDFKNICFGLEGTQMGECYFSNAVLDEQTSKDIISNKLQDNLYDVIASTSIDEKGIASNHSLREIEVVIPLTLEGEISDIPNEHTQNMKKSLNFIKRMGLNRNRGLGRCEFIELNIKDENE